MVRVLGHRGGETACEKQRSTSDALLDGHLLPAEITDDVLALAAHQHQTRVANDNKRAKHKIALAKSLAKPTASVLDGARVCNRAGDALPPHLPNAVVFVDDAFACEIIAARDPAVLPELDMFALALHGGLAASVEYLTSSGQRGPSIFFDAATRTPRGVWLSAGFNAADPLLANLIRRACEDSKWKLVLDDASFLRKVDQLERTKRLMEVVGVVTEREKAIPGFKSLRNVFTKRQFLIFCKHCNLEQSTVGACGI